MIPALFLHLNRDFAIFRIHRVPGIDWQVEVLDGDVQPNPTFSVFRFFYHQNKDRVIQEAETRCPKCSLSIS
jgi:hypothetical protein